MSRFAKLFAANTIALAGVGVALSFSASASAEPALPPAIPDVPALNAIQQLATNPAGVGAILQSAATALNGASQVVSPAQTLPVSPIDVTGTAPLSPALSPALYPPAAPVAAPAANPASALLGPASTLIPMLNQIGIPANLINLAPAATPVAPAAVAPIAPIAPAVAPVAPAAPAVPLLPAGGLLNALP